MKNKQTEISTIQPQFSTSNPPIYQNISTQCWEQQPHLEENLVQFIKSGVENHVIGLRCSQI